MRGIILVILILIVGAAQAAKIIVEPSGENIPVIQNAINNASEGDIIEVHSGNYAEHIYLSKAVTLMGVDAGEGRPVINASGSGSVLILAANGTTVQGFNLTGSGHCGCGSAGISVQSNNNTIINNILYKNFYGVYIKQGHTNTTLISNDFLENRISSFDQDRNQWNGSVKTNGLESLMELISGKQMKGNHYSDYDEPKEGCNDNNHDGICDQPRNITAGKSVDLYPSTARVNR
jgi:parallel beta-helix repeat protein